MDKQQRKVRYTVKKTLIICSLLCLLAAATSLAATSSETGDQGVKQTDSTAATTVIASNRPADSTTSAPVIADTPSDDESKNSPTQITLFGNPIGIYQFDWRLDIERIKNESIGNESNADYISNSADDPSMMLNLTLPLGNAGNPLQLNVGFDIHRFGYSAPVAPVTQAPTTEATTTQTPTTVTPTTQAPVTQAPVTQAPVTTAKPSSGAVPQTVPAMEYTDEDLLWLARIIYAEAGGESLECQIAVGSTVLNRVQSKLFPNTIYDVIFAPNQFSPVKIGTIYNTPSATSYEAARRCLAGERSDTRIIYFQTTASAPGSWMHRTRKFIFSLDGVNFYA